MNGNKITRGLFISFEGIDGSGKSTQLQLLKQYIEKAGRTVRLLREPGGTVVSELVRGLLLDPEVDINPMAELLLFSSARAQMVGEVVQPALERGECVLCDRYVDSSTAYQGFGRELADHEWIRELHKRATAGVLPDRTYLLDLPVAVAAERRGGEAPDRMESAEADFYARVKQGYDWLVQSEPSRFMRIDATRSVEEIHQQILDDVSGLLDDTSGTAPLKTGSST